MNVCSRKVVRRKYFTEILAGWRMLKRCGSRDHDILVSHGDYSGDNQSRSQRYYKDAHIEKKCESIAAVVGRSRVNLSSAYVTNQYTAVFCDRGGPRGCLVL